MVVTVDSALAHVAGALGVPVWVALSLSPDWRWLLERSDSPWYPTARLFRQRHVGEWQPVFAEMAAALQDCAAKAIRRRPIFVEIAAGELIDKITILEIKMERITAKDKLRNIRAELETLQLAHSQGLPASEELSRLSGELKAVNEALWDIEDKIRNQERAKDFGPVFIELARAVYFQNDRRAELKRAINELVGSRLVEEKSYARYS